MWRRLLVAGCCTVAASAAHAQPAHLAPDEISTHATPQAEVPSIDVLTFGIGARIFEKFGHAAICLRYANPDHPTVCFNYGVTDFAAGPIMIWNFLRTQQRFWVEPTSLGSMLSFYEAEDRDIWLQTLPIYGERARALEAKLWSDVQEANRYYYYDHFYDNCSTRLRDMIDQATGGALRGDPRARYPLTFRELGRRGLAGMPPLLVASDLVVGRDIDERPTMWQAMFHPEIFRLELAEKLGAEPRLIYQRQGPAFPVEGSSGRLALFAIGLGFALPLVIAQWRRRWQRAARVWASVPLVVLGVLVWGIAIVSSIPAVRYNEAVLIAVPLDLVLALPLLGPAGRRRYAQGRLAGLALVAALAAIGVLHQPLWTLVLVVVLPMVTIALDLPHGLAARSARGPVAAVIDEPVALAAATAAIAEAAPEAAAGP